MQEKEDKEKELRDLASKARMERAGILSGGDAALGQDDKSPHRRSPERLEDSPPQSNRYNERDGRGQRDRESYYGRRDDDDHDGRYRDSGREESPPGETAEERVARVQREKLRLERRKERERELRLENMKVDQAHTCKV